ncbi:HAMP domain-containing histidine kinase [Myxococcota bacterium]|nr:HAMP domain-containing histidine kinase [Myxococcota bacterium]MBU1382141.1 HAMP domain-containing histidine kinase [Myxococcota bacterium]MBU1495924.1 HAMP domain-containing histidine kinase [Myxococcota bacterium]
MNSLLPYSSNYKIMVFSRNFNSKSKGFESLDLDLTIYFSNSLKSGIRRLRRERNFDYALLELDLIDSSGEVTLENFRFFLPSLPVMILKKDSSDEEIINLKPDDCIPINLFQENPDFFFRRLTKRLELLRKNRKLQIYLETSLNIFREPVFVFNSKGKVLWTNRAGDSFRELTKSIFQTINSKKEMGRTDNRMAIGKEHYFFKKYSLDWDNIESVICFLFDEAREIQSDYPYDLLFSMCCSNQLEEGQLVESIQNIKKSLTKEYAICQNEELKKATANTEHNEVMSKLEFLENELKNSITLRNGINKYSCLEDETYAEIHLDTLLLETLDMISKRNLCKPSIVKNIPSSLVVSGSLDHLRSAISIIYRFAFASLSKKAGNGSNLRISASNVGNRVVFEIADNSDGLSLEQTGFIFDPFRKPVNGMPGFIMALSKSIIEKHHGSISFESIPGHGNRFLITLPCQIAENISISLNNVGSKER